MFSNLKVRYFGSRYFNTMGRFIFRILFRIQIIGKQNMPKQGHFILAANHTSFLDPPAIGFFVRNDLYAFSRSSLFRIFFLSGLLHFLKAIPLREDGSPLSLRKGLEILKQGHILLIFPEGTRSKDGKFLQPMPGIGFLISKSHCPVIPVFVHGANKAWPPGSKRIKPEKITVLFGKPFFPKMSGITKNYKDISFQVMNSIKKLSESFENYQ